ncbi:MAG: hypothetical protein M3300_01745 [Actinomycetota bacterium]|nr:hypothetical protein [Actinomycetota bacterium]
MLTAIDTGELTCSTAYRTRLQGVVVALEALTTVDSAAGRVHGRSLDESGRDG